MDHEIEEELKQRGSGIEQLRVYGVIYNVIIKEKENDNGGNFDSIRTSMFSPWIKALSQGLFQTY